MATSLLFTPDELRLTWDRVKNDHADFRFVDHPHLLAWIDQDSDSWLQRVATSVESGKYAPSPTQPCWVVKPGSLMRPGTILCLEDELIYSLLLGRLCPGIFGGLSDLQGDPDVAYQLAASTAETRWLLSDFRLWSQWREKSLQKLDGASYLLSTDVTACYDNIDIPILMSDLRGFCDLPDELGLLSRCLNTWAHPRTAGIPQGYTASHLLAKVYLQTVDRALCNVGFSHLRYVDDYRLFAQSRREARLGLFHLTALLHRRGLSLQSGKTKIRGKQDGQTAIDGVTPTIESIVGVLQREVTEEAQLVRGYLPGWEIDQILQSRDSPPPEVLERAFEENFGAAGETEFDKSLFHYLLRRLGKAGSRVAMPLCLDILKTRPEETEEVLVYFSSVCPTDTERGAVERYMASGDALYDHQLFQLMRWFCRANICSKDILALCRSWAYDHNRAPWLRSYCVAYIGAWGEQIDLESLEACYAGLNSSIDKADVIVALARMERSRRNSLYARAGTDDMVQRAIAMAKSLS